MLGKIRLLGSCINLYAITCIFGRVLGKYVKGVRLSCMANEFLSLSFAHEEKAFVKVGESNHFLIFNKLQGL